MKESKIFPTPKRPIAHLGPLVIDRLGCGVNSSNMDYKALLKDPRWQKKRLEILQRDAFQCQFCFDDRTELHVHHCVYIPGNNPWDYPDTSLITLCAECHEDESINRPKYIKEAVDIFGICGFAASRMASLASYFIKLNFNPTDGVEYCVLEYAMSVKWDQLRDEYFASIKNHE